MLLRQLRTLLRAAVTDPSVRLLDQPAADPAPQPAEQAAGAGVTPAPHRWVDRHATEPDLVAVAHGAHRWSYRWLSEAANRVAEVLARREVASVSSARGPGANGAVKPNLAAPRCGLVLSSQQTRSACGWPRTCRSTICWFGWSTRTPLSYGALVRVAADTFEGGTPIPA